MAWKSATIPGAGVDRASVQSLGGKGTWSAAEILLEEGPDLRAGDMQGPAKKGDARAALWAPDAQKQNVPGYGLQRVALLEPEAPPGKKVE
jgi:hypothetical protein